MKLTKILLCLSICTICLAACGKQSETDKWQNAGEDSLGKVENADHIDDDDYANEYFIDQFVKLEKEDTRLTREHGAVQLIWNKYADEEIKIKSYEEKKDMNQISYTYVTNGFNIDITEIDSALVHGTINLAKDMTKENKYKYLTLSLFSITKNISKYNLNKIVEETYNIADNKLTEYNFDDVNVKISKKFSNNTEYLQITWSPTK